MVTVTGLVITVVIVTAMGLLVQLGPARADRARLTPLVGLCLANRIVPPRRRGRARRATRLLGGVADQCGRSALRGPSSIVRRAWGGRTHAAAPGRPQSTPTCEDPACSIHK